MAAPEAHADRQRLWSEAASKVSDPGMTIRELPPAWGGQAVAAESREEVEPVFIVESTGRETSLLAPGQAVTTTKSRVSGRCPDGVAGEDFFSFRGVLGQGGMGVVYFATQQSMGREVAVKTLRKEGLKEPARVDAFLREASTTAALTHPNIPPVHFLGSDTAGRPFMVMKRVQGRPWSEMLHPSEAIGKPRRPDQGDIDLRLHLDIFLKVCDAVAFAHAHHVIHRDLKPANVMVGDYGEVVVMDWGLALDISEKGKRDALAREGANSLAGTPAYMSPEMVNCDFENIDTRTDIFLLGAVLHEIVTGRAPFEAETVVKALGKAATGRLDRIAIRPGLERGARDLERILRTAMAIQPSHRYRDVAALQADIRAFLAGQGERQESECLTLLARQELQKLAKEVENRTVTSPFYPRCTEILAKTQQALALWGFNPRAMRLRQEALTLFADMAMRGQDWGLAESLLRDLRLTGSGGAAMATPLENELRATRERLRVREYMTHRAFRATVAAVVILVVLSSYLVWRNHDTERALETAKSEAEKRENALRTAPAPVAAVVSPPPEAPARPEVPQLLPPLKLPGSCADGCRLLASAGGALLVLDSEGRTWLWSPAAGTTILPLPVLNGQPVHAATWIDAQNVLLASAGGDYLAGPPLAPDGPAWRRPFRLPIAIRALAGRAGSEELALGTIREVLVVHSQRAPPLLNVQVPVLALGYQPNGDLLVVTTRGLRLWRLEGQSVEYDFEVPASSAVISPRGLRVALTRETEGELSRIVSFVDIDLEKTRVQQRVPVVFKKGKATTMAFSADGTLLVAGSDAGEVAIVDLHHPAADRVLTRSVVHERPVRAVAASPDGMVAYTVNADGHLFSWGLTHLLKDRPAPATQPSAAPAAPPSTSAADNK